MQTNLSYRKQISGCLGMEWGGNRGKKGLQKSMRKLWGDGYVPYFDYGDDFMVVYIHRSKLIELCTSSMFCMPDLHKTNEQNPPMPRMLYWYYLGNEKVSAGFFVFCFFAM